MKLYKVTNENNKTRGGMQWGENITNHAKGPKGQPLCTDGWIHAYESLELAVLMLPAHVKYQTPKFWESEGELGIGHEGTKCGCRSLTTIRLVNPPIFSTELKVKFAIGCAWQVTKAINWRTWALNWLSNKNRSRQSAAAAASAAAYAASDAAFNAANVACAAADAAADADAYADADAADYAANAAADAAYNKILPLNNIIQWMLSNSSNPEEI